MSYSKRYSNYCAQSKLVRPSPLKNSLDNSERFNSVISSTSLSIKAKNNIKTDQKQLMLNNLNDNYCEQSDRSLTVMIPRAKYHHSPLLSQTQLMHHQLSVEKVYESSKPKSKLDSLDNELGIQQKHVI